MRRSLFRPIPGLLLLLAAQDPAAAQQAVITGQLSDSLRRAPLVGARVSVLGTDAVTRTGADGRYLLRVPVAGDRVLSIEEPRLRRLVGDITIDVTLAAGDTTRVNYFLPARTLSSRDLCPLTARLSTAVLGVVRDSATGEPLGGIEVLAWWAGDSFRADTTVEGKGVRGRSGDDGGFVLCGLPAGRPLGVGAKAPGREVAREGVVLAEGAVLDLDLLAAPTEVVAAGTGVTLAGRVRSAERNEPVMDAEIELIGLGRRTTTGGDGGYRFDAVPAEVTVLAVRRVGFRPHFQNLTLAPGEDRRVDVALQSAPISLPELSVEGERAAADPSGFEARRLQGRGRFIDQGTLESRSGSQLSELLRDFPAVQISRTRDGRNIMINTRIGGGCPVPVSVDGKKLGGRTADALISVDQFRLDDIRGVEFYAGIGQIPSELQHLGGQCGLLVIWTRFGR